MDLSFQLIGDEKFKTICKSVPNSLTPLIGLNISGNKITDISLQSLSQVFRSFHSIKYLNISSNMFSDRGSDDLYFFLLFFFLLFFCTLII